MKALLRADLYRLLHSKFFYILAAVALALALVTFGLLVLIQTLASEMAGEALGLSVSAFQRLSFDGTVGYFSVIASAVFICGDYAGGGIRGKIVIGCGRREIFYSKLILSAAMSAVLYLIGQAAVFVLGGIYFGWEGVSAYDTVSLFIAGLAMSLAFAAVFSGLALILQKLSSALVFGIVAMFALSLVLSLLSAAGSAVDSRAFTVFCDVFARLTPVGQNTALAAGADDYWVHTAVSLAWVAASALLVPLRFKKLDLK